jgi:hypothetical protein
MKTTAKSTWRTWRHPIGWLTGVALWVAPARRALADIAPGPLVVVSLLQLVNWFAFIPFSGVYALAYVIVLLRKERLPALTLLGSVHVVVGLVIATATPTLGLMQAALGLAAIGLDRLVLRAVRHQEQKIQASESSFSMPTMGPVTTKGSRANTRQVLDDELNQASDTTKEQTNA